MIKKLWVELTGALGRVVLRAWPAALGKIFVWRVINRSNSRLGIEPVGRTRWGGQFRCNLRDLVQNRIFYTGAWEPSLTDLLERRLTVSDVFIDVGANVGYFSILAAKLVGPTGRVISVEASPRMFARLNGNLELNGLTNVRAINAAASDTAGTLEVYAADEVNLGKTSVLASRGGRLEARVQARTLRDLVGDADLSAARCIKIDVEGYEGPVLRHLIQNADILRRDVTIVAEISWSALRELGTSAEALFEAAAAVGFEWAVLENPFDWTALYDTAPRPLTPLRGAHLQADIVFSRRHGWLAVSPQEASYFSRGAVETRRARL